MGPAHPLEARVGLGLEAALEELRAENRALLAAIERLEDAFAEQKVHLVEGYVVPTWPAADGGFLGRCPSLHAVAKQPSEPEVLDDVGRAMAAVLEGYQTMGKAHPPKDVTA